MSALVRDAADVHHDMTWLIGALARDLMARGRNPGVIEMLARLSACDFSRKAVGNIPPASAPACRFLPEAVSASLHVVRETATALAAAAEHLPWRARGEGAAEAHALGARAPLRARAAEVSLFLMEPGGRMRLEPSARDALFLALTGPSRWRTEGAALLALEAGQTLFVSSGHGVRIQAGRTPLLAARLQG